MEGVGARLGRSSTRYGPPTVFTGPVRKWKKKWVHISSSNKKDNSSSAAASVVNGGSASDASNGSHLLLFKWAPLSQSGNGNGNEDGKSECNSPSEDPLAAEAAEDPPRRRFKYVPIAVLEEQKKEVTEIEEDDIDKAEEDDKVEEDQKKEITEIEEDDKVEVDGKVVEDASAAEPSEKKAEVEEKPDMNDVPMEDNQEEKIVRQDLNESTMDSGLNLNANNADADSENNPKGAEPLEK